MFRLSMPHLIRKDNKRFDLYFELLDMESRKKLLKDLKNGISIKVPNFGDVAWNDIDEIEQKRVERLFKASPPPYPLYRYDENTHEYKKILKARSVLESFLKLAGYDRDKLVPGYKRKFLINDHKAEKAGHHFDLRLEFPVKSLHEALGTYEGKRLPGTPEPLKEFPDKPGTVYRSFAVRKHTLPTESSKLFVVETEDHPIQYESFHGTIPEGYGAGEVEIYDKGTFEIIDVEGDKKYTVEFKGEKLNGLYSFVKYQRGYLWIKNKDQSKKASIKPSIFKHTIYRLPTKDELIEVDSCNLSADEIYKGFCYTIVGRGFMGESQKDMIIKSIQMLCNMFPYNVFYKESLKKAEAIELHHSKTASAIGGHEPVQLLFYEIQDTPYLELVKKIVSNILKEARDFSCITAPLPWDAAEEIRQWGLKNIPDEDLINDGRESEVHVTVLYGLHGHDPYEIRPIIDGFGPVKLTLGEISIFENEDQDVVKISVDSPDLVRLNKLIADKFEYTKTHPKYIPHVTLAYLKPGLGKKYVGRKDFAGKEITISEILFSGNDYRETTFPL